MQQAFAALVKASIRFARVRQGVRIAGFFDGLCARAKSVTKVSAGQRDITLT